MLFHSNGVVVNDNKLDDPENNTKPDPDSGSAILGVAESKDIFLDGKRQPDATKQTNRTKAE